MTGTSDAPKPRASIVMPLRVQRDDWLECSVRSALGQTVTVEVVVVVADETPAENLELLRRLGESAAPDRLLRVVVRDRPGFPAAVNTGIRAASTERVGLLFTDDWLEPHAVAACVSLGGDVVASNKSFFAEDGVTPLGTLGPLRTMETYARCASDLRRAEELTHFFLFRRALVLEVGGLDETLGDAPGIDDFDLVWTLLEHGASVAIVPEMLYACRDHAGDRLTLRPAGQQLATLGRILDKHGVTGDERADVLAEHARWFGRTIAASADAPLAGPVR